MKTFFPGPMVEPARKKRGKRGGKKRKEAIKLLADSDCIESTETPEQLNSVDLHSTPLVKTPQPPQQVQQMPHLSFEAKSYFTSLEPKLDDPDSMEGTPCLTSRGQAYSYYCLIS